MDYIYIYKGLLFFFFIESSRSNPTYNSFHRTAVPYKKSTNFSLVLGEGSAVFY